ncbi:DUF1801 domain-containing protein [Faecalicatena contorta]|nr:DUF1801 domain-containing protein [Faecalicatena contorta]
MAGLLDFFQPIEKRKGDEHMWQCPKCKREFKNMNQDHFCGEAPKTIDEYIKAHPEQVRPILAKVRETIRTAAPDAVEKISWSMPTFWQEENLIHFAAFKKHLGIYPGDLSLNPFEERLAGYHRTKGAIHFPYDKPVDYELIADITRWRVSHVKGSGKQIDSKKKSNADINTEKMTRQIYDIPNFVITALDANGLWERYRLRPSYQRNDYIGWIIHAKREETRQRRLAQMLEELQSGDTYMGTPYNAKLPG